MRTGRGIGALAIVAACLTHAGPAHALAAKTATARLQTPVLSLRRAPALLARAIGTVRLDAALDTALADPKAGATNACLIVRQGGATLYSHNPTQTLIPGSNLKLLTAAAVLDKLDPNTRLTTDVRADQAPAGGVINGNLYLIGGGDPLLRTPDFVASLKYPEVLYTHLDDLAAKVAAAGITHITGGVVGDESRYDTTRLGPGWRPAYVAEGDVGPLSALQVNDGFLSFPPHPPKAAPQPAEAAAATFTTLLKGKGVAVDRPPSVATAPPAAAEITAFPAAPLTETVAEVLRQSDNDGAELLTKELARHAGGPATTAAGLNAIRADLQAAGLPVDQMVAVDGSGLDRNDRVSCELILATLERGGPDGPLAKGLSVAGQSGTLIRRMRGTAAAGRLMAKTGTLAGVASLSGFVAPNIVHGPNVVEGPNFVEGRAGGPDLAFSLIVNGSFTIQGGDAFTDHMGVLLAQFPQTIVIPGPLPAE
jgi:D-alanyl-D-alanine carboxypeptidase/D-alanyl-D-alanine-endopeptidase (penicillin-binding protein 4)